MPSQHQAADRRERRQFDDRHVDEAARWLDREVIGRADRETIVRTLIQSIDRVARVRGWRAAERRLARLDDRQPRTGIVRALDQREDELADRGERPDRLMVGPREPCDCCDGDETTAAEVREQRAAEREKRLGGYSPSSVSADQSSGDESEAATLAAFADGGESA